jgi:Fe-S cluster assembly protein SufD
MNNIEYFKDKFDQLQSTDSGSSLAPRRALAFAQFSKMGIPTLKNEDWKYTRVGGLFNQPYCFALDATTPALSKEDLADVEIPGHENANSIVFINGVFSPALSRIHSPHLVVLPLEEAARGEYQQIISTHLGHSSHYQTDGINALSMAFVHGAVFVLAKKGYAIDRPLSIYHVSDARESHRFCQPRSLVYVSEQSNLQMVEAFTTLGEMESFSNHVTEIVVETEGQLGYYKIQNDKSHANQVSTTHIRQIGKSFSHSVTISLDGGMVRNNLNVILDSPRCESHLYGLYCLKGKSHIDSHTVVDNMQPNSLSNELYKGIVDDQAVAVFNGKIFVRKDAQKTNAYQSNKNILLNDQATVNSKPQLEIFADDVKCSHGCTVGSLDEEALFYLRSRGLSKDDAKSFLLRAFALDILENIKLLPIRSHVDQLISKRLEIDAF